MTTVTKIVPVLQPEHATINWLNTCIERGRAGQPFTEFVLMTPGAASALLSRNENNRNISDRRVEAYASDMIAGRWALNGEAILVASSGDLNDGQHRLQAVITSNRPQMMGVTFGLSRETRVTVDQGAARTAAHYLSMQGRGHSALSAGIVRIVMAYERTRGEAVKIDLTHAEVVGRALADDGIGASAVFTDHVRKFCKGMLTPSQIGACHYLFTEVHPADAKEYLTQLCIGENIKRHDPAFTIRQALENLKGDHRFSRIELVFRGFVAFRQGRKLQLAKCLGSLPALV